ncbi:MAG: winged helix-turn-helix domain-containing protein [Pyrinomonadaceae bacterium]|nr:winged helix-turn-helix domain-containing protein [Pyrinomonadaceae bacterium]MBP6212251.1 winged helix-turn-helix domain-containing protein [Pyrinomonadaceae bacterium]
MQKLTESRVYEFGDFRLDAKNHRLYLRDSGKLIHLTPKAAELLIVLVQGKGRLLTKDELLDTVWAGSIVEEANLSQTIFVLRKALGDGTKEPKYILTIPGRGYQFVGDVDETNSEDSILEEIFLSDPPAMSTETASPRRKLYRYRWTFAAVPLLLLVLFGVYRLYPPANASGREIRTIAVLPFEDLSIDQTDKYLGVSFTDALINKFGGLRQIVVRPTSSVLKYAGYGNDHVAAGRELMVDAVIDGRIQRVGERVRVNVQLIRVADSAAIWTGSFDESFTDFLAVQDSISRKVVESLALQIDKRDRGRFDRRGTENAPAYQEYLLGRFFWNKRTAEDLDRAIEHYGRAIELDPNFAKAYVGLAEVHAIYPNFTSVRSGESLPKARSAATRALELDGELAEAITVLAYVQAQYDRNWGEAEASYLRSLELNPNNANTRQWYGEFLAFQNRIDESLSQLNRAIELDPTSLSTNTAPALPYLISGQFEKVIKTTDRVLQMDANFLFAKHYKARALVRMGRKDEGFELYQKVVATSKGSLFFKSDLACLYGKAGNTTEARRVLLEMTAAAKERPVSPYHLGIVHLGLGENEIAFDLLRKAVAEHDNNVIVLKVGANFDSVRNDPRFVEILRSANF